MKLARFLLVFTTAALVVAAPFTADATVTKEGAWPNHAEKVDLTFEGKSSEGLRKLAKEAGWSLVVSNAVALDEGTDVRIDVDAQPADAVLDALFVGHDVVAYRNGDLVTVKPASAAVAPSGAVASPPMPAPSVPSVRGEDRSVFGGKLVVREGEVVHTVTVMGGSLEVEGTVTGDLVVVGGSAKVRRSGHVLGNGTAFGGSLEIEGGARVDGDVGVIGGVLKRDEGAVIGGRIVDENHRGRVNVSVSDGTDGVKTKVTPDEKSGGSRLLTAAHEFGQSMTKMALLFVLGCVLLALLAPRMEKLRVEVASRPMRSFAVGILGSLVGTIGGVITIAVLCITMIGIPVALFGVLLTCLAVYGAIASVLTTFGAAVAGHRTENQYIHLLVGCAAFLVLSSLPWIGGLVTFAVVMIAVGALVATRVAGVFDRRRPLPPPGLI